MLPFQEAEAAIAAFDAMKNESYAERQKAAYAAADAVLACIPVACINNSQPRDVIANQLLGDQFGPPRPSQWFRDLLASDDYKEKQSLKAGVLEYLFKLKYNFGV